MQITLCHLRSCHLSIGMSEINQTLLIATGLRFNYLAYINITTTISVDG